MIYKRTHRGKVTSFSITMEENKRFPLGENVYAYVRTRKGCTHIHIRHFVMPTDTKGGRGVVASVKGVKMDLKMLNRLCKVKKNISDEFKIQVNTREKKKKKKNKTEKRKPPSSPPSPSSSPQIIRQRQTDLIPSLPFPLPSTDFPHDPQCVCHRLSGLTPKYPVASSTELLPSTATPTTTPPTTTTTTTLPLFPSLFPPLP